jgi:hypothetical protein
MGEYTRLELRCNKCGPYSDQLPFSSKCRPHFQASFGTKQIRPWFLMGPEIKNGSAGDSHQQFTGLNWRLVLPRTSSFSPPITSSFLRHLSLLPSSMISYFLASHVQGLQKVAEGSHTDSLRVAHKGILPEQTSL